MKVERCPGDKEYCDVDVRGLDSADNRSNSFGSSSQVIGLAMDLSMCAADLLCHDKYYLSVV